MRLLCIQVVSIEVWYLGHVSSSFDPPEGVAPFSYVFDLTGEIHISRPADMHIKQTALPAYLIGREANTRKVKSYVRFTTPYYETSLEKTAHTESESLKPSNASGTWYHEALRILADFEEYFLLPGLGGSF
jgi:hypothetical protein